MEILKYCAIGLAFAAVYLLISEIGRSSFKITGKPAGLTSDVRRMTSDVLSRLFRRGQTLEAQLPGALDFLASSLRSGSSVTQAISLLADEFPQPVSGEFGMVLKETRMGLPLQESLENLRKRVRNADLDLAVTSIIISRETGASLSEVLGKISSVIRERGKIIGKAKALVSQGKMQSIVVGVLPVILCFVILAVDPGYTMPLFRRPLGWAMIAAACGLEFLGVFFIRKITRIEV
ncbi:hypothetical protein CO111_03040 [Candidatus Desantisbacteria bacterium CG_4_9_14_3_um_filter_50_7]|nr:MAG: hypothetical protein CO111_03040 [Candidatus Desantisbacteria bacterium CG_4_9_14_3_um_filter_50_7]